jgi:hypothetical protein
LYQQESLVYLNNQGETPEQFAARQKAAEQFQIRQQSLSGLAPHSSRPRSITTTSTDS